MSYRSKKHQHFHENPFKNVFIQSKFRDSFCLFEGGK